MPVGSFGMPSKHLHFLSHDQDLHPILAFSAPNTLAVFQFLGQIILWPSSGPWHMLFYQYETLFSIPMTHTYLLYRVFISQLELSGEPSQTVLYDHKSLCTFYT